MTVSLSPGGRLSVDNDGPAVPPETLGRLTDRFTRHGPATGSGLGLAIVAAIARRADLDLRLHSPRPGRADGFAATLDMIPA